MRTLLDEILNTEAAPAGHSCACNKSRATRHAFNCNCARCRQSTFHGDSWSAEVSGTTPSPVTTLYQRVYPLPVLPDGRKPRISSGHWSVNPDPDRKPRPNPNHLSQAECKPSYLWYQGVCYSKPGSPGHLGADIMYPYQPNVDPPKEVLVKKNQMENRSSSFWTPEGLWVMAFAPGRVTQILNNDNGKALKILHPDGLETRYLHLADPIVKVGDPVNAGTPIAQLTQDEKKMRPMHLHFEIRLKDRHQYKASVDPTPYLQNIPYRTQSGIGPGIVPATPASSPRSVKGKIPPALQILIAPLNKYRGEIPLHFLLGWIKIESDGNNSVITRLNERGYFQIHPEESKDNGFDHNRLSTDKDYSIQSGIRLVRSKMRYADGTARKLGIARGSDLYWHIVKLWHWVPLCVDVITKEMQAQGFKPRTWEEFRGFMLRNRSKIKELVIRRANKWNNAWDVGVGINNVDKLFAAANSYR